MLRQYYFRFLSQLSMGSINQFTRITNAVQINVSKKNSEAARHLMKSPANKAAVNRNKESIVSNAALKILAY